MSDNVHEFPRAGQRQEPPVKTELEQALLGAILVRNEAYDSVCEVLRPEHFGHAVNGRIYSVISEILKQGGRAELIAVEEALGEDPVLLSVGGSGIYLSRLLTSAGVPLNAKFYAADIIKSWRAREIFKTACLMQNIATDPGEADPEIAVKALADLVDEIRPHRAPMVCAADLAELDPPDRTWIVRDWLPSRTVTLLTGDGGTGKSQLAMQLQIAASAGIPWIGLPIEQCRSIGFYAEDEPEELHRRLKGIMQMTGVSADKLCHAHWHSAVNDHAELVDIDQKGTVQPTEYFHYVERMATEFRARLIILDAVTNLFGLDEIKRNQVNEFIVMLRRLAMRIDGAVVLLGHPSAAGMSSGSGLSGSTHWNNAVRSRLYFQRATGDDADPDERTLTKMKANYASAGDILRVKWKGGGFAGLDEPTNLDKAALKSRAERVFLSLLDITYRDGEWTSPNKSSRTYAPLVFSKRHDREGVEYRDFEQAMFRLRSAGLVITEVFGYRTQPKTRLRKA